MSAALPPAAHPGSYRIDVVCLGNICRSAMAHVVLADALAEAGLADRVEVSSSGTGDWHVGEPMDTRAAATLYAAGLDPSAHRAEQFDDARVGRHDLVLAMDADNARTLGRLGVGERLRMFRDFDPDGPGDVSDPWFGGQAGFDTVLETVRRTSDRLVGLLAAALETENQPGTRPDTRPETDVAREGSGR